LGWNRRSIGNLEVQRYWGNAKDHLGGLHMILQADNPDDFVLATCETCSVGETAELSFAQIGSRMEWHGTGVDGPKSMPRAA